jgi:DNA-binding NarL/FixJ family response regulator
MLSAKLKRYTGMLVAAAVWTVIALAVLPSTAGAQEDEGKVPAKGPRNTNQSADATAMRPASEPASSVVVRPGDSLWSIAQEQLGPNATPEQFYDETERIYELNRDRIGDNPNLILTGQELLLRAVAQPAAVAQPPAAEEEGEPAAATVERLPEPNNGERLLIGLGVLVLLALSSVLVLLMVRKLPSTRRDVEGPGAWKHPLEASHKGPANETYDSRTGHFLSHASGAKAPRMQPEQLLHAPTGASEGKRVFPRKLLNKLAEELLPRELLNELAEEDSRQDLPALIHRQLGEILELIVQGKSDAEIAQQLCLSESTVKQYLRSVHKSLGVKNGTQAKASHKVGATATQTSQTSRSPNHAEVGERATSDTAQPTKPGSETPGLIWVKCPYPVVSLGLEAGLEASGCVHCREEEDSAENIPSSVIYFPNGEDAASEVERLRLVTRDAPILILGLHDDPQLARTALLTGASGFVHLGMQPEQIVHALTMASEGKLVFPRKLLNELERELMKENPQQEPSALTHIMMLQRQPTEELRPTAPGFSSKERERGSKMSRVLLVEPHRALRQALASSLDWEPDLQVVAQTDSLAECRSIALDEIDVALVETGLPDGDGIDLVGEVSSYGVPVVAMTTSSRADVRVRALKAGAIELLGKNASFEELAEVTRSAVAVSPTRKGEAMVAVDDRPYRELGDFLDSLVRECLTHEPHTIAEHIGKVADYEVSPQRVASYLYGTSLPEPPFFPAFAEAFSLTAEERKDLAWLYSYGCLPNLNCSRG